MITILEKTIKYKVRCPHCKCLLEFENEDIYSTYMRGLEDCPGWVDVDRKWNYITCPHCGKYVSVDNVID